MKSITLKTKLILKTSLENFIGRCNDANDNDHSDNTSNSCRRLTIFVRLNKQTENWLENSLLFVEVFKISFQK